MLAAVADCGVECDRFKLRSVRMRRAAKSRAARRCASEVAMISSRLSQYFDQRGVQYEVSEHRLSHCSAQTARVAHVSPRQVAKSVILEDDGGFVMAVIPADRYVMVGRLATLLGRHKLHLSDENRIATVFGDCDRGAVPPVGMAWGVETVVDEDLEGHEVVYLEGGDHRRLLRMPGAQFAELMRAARHGRFSKSPTH
jgi:Ala-tRNA(Pro) deacylase